MDPKSEKKEKLLSSTFNTRNFLLSQLERKDYTKYHLLEPLRLEAPPLKGLAALPFPAFPEQAPAGHCPSLCLTQLHIAEQSCRLSNPLEINFFSFKETF